jgi:hypothetical protein
MTFGSLTAACLKSRQAVIQQWLDQISIAIGITNVFPHPKCKVIFLISHLGLKGFNSCLGGHVD